MTTTARAFDPTQVEVWRHLLSAIPDEMGVTLERTAFSPNIKERLDHSCAIFDVDGRLLAQAAHIPVHLGAMPLMMDRLRATLRWAPGDMWLTNDPRYGGTHLPDLTLVAPVFQEGRPRPGSGRTRSDTALIGFVASRAHHADIGGLAPGSLTLSQELYHEGIIVPPVKLVERGRVRSDVLDLLCGNSRTPAERRGDMSAQVSANRTGSLRFQALAQRYGVGFMQKRSRENAAYAEAVMRRTIRALPPGSYSAEDRLDDDGAGGRDVPIRVRVTVLASGDITFDFTGTGPQVGGAMNATEAVTRSACYYVARCLAPEEMPTNAGCFAPIAVVAPEGTVVNAEFGRAIAAGNLETSQRIVDVAFAALAAAAPDRVPAASQGTMNNLTIGGLDPYRGRPFAYYETMAGGAGASAARPGAGAIHTHMTNTRNTPVESLESEYPLRVLEYRIAPRTGGRGLHPGGKGIIRTVELLAPARVSLLSERRVRGAPGAAGGEPGAPGACWLTPLGGRRATMPGKWSRACEAGAIVSIRTPGGGGWGTGAATKRTRARRD